jgi:glycosyltransferase involved in cell wall biosynthesis
VAKPDRARSAKSGNETPGQDASDGMSQDGRVVVLSAYRFPYGDAMSNRLLQLARAASLPNEKALVVNVWPERGGGPESAEIPHGIDLTTIATRGRGRLGRLASRAVRPLQVVNEIRSAGIRRNNRVTLIIPQGLFGVISFAIYRAALACTVIVDVTERHDPGQFRRGKLAPYLIRHRWTAALTKVLPRKVIVVSRLLADIFGERNETMVVPPQVDCDEYPPASPGRISDSLKLIYAGAPGTKDMLHVVVKGIQQLSSEEQRRIVFVIAGIRGTDQAKYSDLRASSFEGIDSEIALVGRVTRAHVVSLLENSHFSILVRPRGGYADAGFPSKIPESLAAGCPVLATSTGDLKEYIFDGKEGILIEECTANAVSRSLRRALALSEKQWLEMSRHARVRAERDFDYRANTEVRRFVHGRPERK